MTTPNVPLDPAPTPPDDDAATRLAEEIARRAYTIWASRQETADRQRQDWLEAEAQLALESATNGQLTAAHERLVRSVAERQEAERQLAAEHEVGSILAASEAIADAAPRVAEALGTILGWDACIFWLADPQANLLRCLDVWLAPGLPLAAFDRDARARTFSAASGLPGRVWTGGRSVWTPDVAADPDDALEAIAAEGGLRAAVGFPVCGGGACHAVVECFSRYVREPNDQLTSVLNNIGGQIGQFVERRTAERRLQQQEHDRRVGREIQRSLLPKTKPRLPGFEVGGRSLAPHDVGGDCFDYVPLPGADRDSTGVLVADASGHGIGAALLVGQAQAYLRGVALTATDVGLLLDLTNRCLSTDPLSSTFVTAVLLRLDPGTRSMSYASAGHPTGYVLDAEGRTRVTLESVGPPLGVEATATFPAATVALESGDLVVLVTDGITEAAPRDGTAFGMDRVLELVRKHRHQSPDDIVTALFVAVLDHCIGNCLDDLTAVVVKVDGGPPADALR